MFILTDGKNYVMENPIKQGAYISTTSKSMAKEFSYKQARNLIQNKRKQIAWIRKYHMINTNTGEEEKNISKYSNEGAYIGDKAIDFDYSIVDTIKNEVTSIIGLAAWDCSQLNTYKVMLNQGLSFYDSAISDVRHARLDKRPPAHIRTKIDGIVNDLEEKRRDIKQTKNYIDILSIAINEQWTIDKVQTELIKAKYVPYKGRTEYFSMVDDLLKNY